VEWIQSVCARSGVGVLCPSGRLSSVSEATGEPERIEMFTTLLRDRTLFHVLAVGPHDCVSDYVGTYRRVVGSIQIMDGDRCVCEETRQRRLEAV
jgi:hypothetical protein